MNAELFKIDPETAAGILEPLFRIIWTEACVPEDWTKGVIIKITKKSTLSDCNNWRSITLLSIPSKILSKVIISRISTAVDTTLRKEQAGAVQNGFLLCETSSNRVRNGKGNSTWISLTLRKPLIAYTETACGTFWGLMESQITWWNSSRVSTTTTTVVWEEVAFGLKWPVSGKAVWCLRYSSISSLTGWCDAQQRQDIPASDGRSSPH